jgi:hypothetical protein
MERGFEVALPKYYEAWFENSQSVGIGSRMRKRVQLIGLRWSFWGNRKKRAKVGT